MTNTNTDLIAIVNNKDEIIGFKEKIEVHKKGILHRAFSVFIFNSKGEMLLQKRALQKYHSPGLWTNACCSHLLPNKTMNECAHNRLVFEMGFDCEINKVFSFQYLAPFENGLTENEIDHVYTGLYNNNPKINSDEVHSYKWVTMNDLKNDIKNNTEDFTFWFKSIIAKYFDQLHL